MVVTSSMDLFGLFVEGVFGNLLFAIIGIAVIYAIICMMARMSLLMTSAVTILFLLCMTIGLFGSMVAIIIFVFSALFFFSAIIPWIRGWLP